MKSLFPVTMSGQLRGTHPMRTKVTKQSVLEDLKAGGVDIKRVKVGATAHANHASCPEGPDTRGRLYVTHKAVPKGLFVWYCHNCGNGGAFKATASAVASKTVTIAPSRASQELRIRALWDQSLAVADAPDAVQDWVAQRGGVGAPFLRWHPMENALLFGVWYNICLCDTAQPPPALQIRSFSPGSIKWLTVKGSDTGPLRTLYGPTEPHCGTDLELVLVEDQLSAYRLWDVHPTFRSYCLFGAHATMDELSHLIRQVGYKHILVWLDNDNPTVLQSSMDIARRAKLLGAEVRVERTQRDPKYAETDILMRPYKEYELA
jgi:hypothetical protein